MNMNRKEKKMVRKTRKMSWLLVGAALLFVVSGSTTQSEAGVNVNVGDDGVNVTVGGEGVNVNVGSNLPAIRFAAPPLLVVIPGTYVYIVPDFDVDVLFFQGSWWRPFEGHWYRSRDYNGQWSYVEQGRIPSGLRSLPQDYRHRLSPGYERIPHGDVERNWEKWEKEKYWDRRGEKGRGGRDGDRHDDRRDNDDHR
jgi:hypothetical protein